MNKTKKSEPEQIDLTHEQIDELRQRLLASNLDGRDKEIMLGLMSFNFWVRQQLASATLSIRKLKRLFGFRREKKSLKIPMM